MDTPTTTAPVPTHMVKAILATLFCCLPLGIVAIVKAASVGTLTAAGQSAEALQASEAANKWGNLAIGIGLALGVISAILQVVAGGAGEM